MDPDYTKPHIQTPDSVHTTDLYLAFSDAFGDYKPSVGLTLPEFRQKFFVHYQTDRRLSRLALVNAEIAAFILSTPGNYRNRRSAYLSAVGVRQKYRGMGLLGALFDDLITQLKQEQFEQCLLEVLSSNERAIRIFESKGFRETRRFLAYSGPARNLNPPENYSFIVKNNLYFPFREMEITDNVNFQETPSFMRKERKRLLTIVSGDDQQEKGYLILNPVSGRIRHIFVHPEYRRAGIGRSMIQYAITLVPKLKIINVDRENHSLRCFLEALGFHTQLEQIEMIMELK
ncbi:GNAT family N-acetyltransferase [Fulvivirga sedimenti]|uniref:GNAT family N-acetyltransferase n=1 Tax=Fulvivirga sedimenti TaxID=2879465 RepID=A0A9X1L117_9BACT|nr:GNAT family N-acetyltransferase [Fulvivirga sedimenti]MCA6078454.1 GNAT family N-acetyltransferase [Fulvivirga sedimenti]